MKHKKLLFAATAIAMAAATNANAQSFVAGSLRYTIGGDSVTVKADTKADENIAIPDSVEYGEGEAAKKYAVKGIDPSGFFGCTKLRSITLPQTITDIGRAAFWNCKSLEALDIPEAVTAINPAVFTLCRSLKRISAGKRLKSIEPGSFMSCTSLDNIEISEENPHFKSDGGTVYTKDGETLLAHTGSAAKFSIPQGVKTIGNSAFWYCENMKSVAIPASVTTIEKDAFNGSGLTEVSIPQSVASIGDMAFGYCNSLDTVRVEWQKPPAITRATFQNNTRTLIVPEGTSDTYRAAQGWNAFRNIAETPTGIKNIKKEENALRATSSGGTATLESATFSGIARITSAAGEAVRTLRLKPGEKATLTLPKGTYIINTDNAGTKKFLVR